MKISKNIRQLRTSRGMTQDALAEKLYVTRQTISNYETGKSHPDVEMLVQIAAVLETDVNALIYGPAPDVQHKSRMRLAVGAGLTLFCGFCYGVLGPVFKQYAAHSYNVGMLSLIQMLIKPLFLLSSGWTMTQLASMALKWRPLDQRWARWAALALVILLAVWLFISVWFLGANILNTHLYRNHIRGEWLESIVEYEDGTTGTVSGWAMLPAPVPDWAGRIVWWIGLFLTERKPCTFLLLGAALWYLGFPKKKTI